MDNRGMLFNNMPLPIHTGVGKVKTCLLAAFWAMVRFEQLEEFAAKGFLNMSEIKMFRRVVNVEQQFVLMELANEERCKNWFNQRLNKLSELSRRRN
jgi:hypothetical protein